MLFGMICRFPMLLSFALLVAVLYCRLHCCCAVLQTAILRHAPPTSRAPGRCMHNTLRHSHSCVRSLGNRCTLAPRTSHRDPPLVPLSFLPQSSVFYSEDEVSVYNDSPCILMSDWQRECALGGIDMLLAADQQMSAKEGYVAILP